MDAPDHPQRFCFTCEDVQPCKDVLVRSKRAGYCAR
jgi:hypothetical protein